MEAKLMEDKKTEQETAELAKKEVKEERTVQGKFYTPLTDIVETEEALFVTMDMPGVQKENVNIDLDKDVLKVEGLIDSAPYIDAKPLYTEYNVGHYARRFNLSKIVDQERIEANLNNGVLTLTLPKAPEAQPKQITVH